MTRSNGGLTTQNKKRAFDVAAPPRRAADPGNARESRDPRPRRTQGNPGASLDWSTDLPDSFEVPSWGEPGVTITRMQGARVGAIRPEVVAACEGTASSGSVTGRESTPAVRVVGRVDGDLRP